MKTYAHSWLLDETLSKCTKIHFINGHSLYAYIDYMHRTRCHRNAKLLKTELCPVSSHILSELHIHKAGLLFMETTRGLVQESVHRWGPIRLCWPGEGDMGVWLAGPAPLSNSLWRGQFAY